MIRPAEESDQEAIAEIYRRWQPDAAPKPVTTAFETLVMKDKGGQLLGIALLLTLDDGVTSCGLIFQLKFGAAVPGHSLPEAKAQLVEGCIAWFHERDITLVYARDMGQSDYVRAVMRYADELEERWRVDHPEPPGPMRRSRGIYT